MFASMATHVRQMFDGTLKLPSPPPNPNWIDIVGTTLRCRQRRWTRIVSDEERQAVADEAIAVARSADTVEAGIEAMARLIEDVEQDWCSQSISHWGVVLPVRTHG